MITNGYKNSYYYQGNFYIDNYWVDWGNYVAPANIYYETIGMIKGLLNNSITIYNITESVSTDTFENLKTQSTGTAFTCRISPLSEKKRFFAHKYNIETSHLMYSAWSTLFGAGDQILYDGDTYEIIGIVNPSEWNKLMQTELKHVG
jgi:hypothetical protein